MIESLSTLIGPFHIKMLAVLLNATQWTVYLSLTAFIGGGLIGLIFTLMRNFGSSIFILDSEEIRLRGIRSAIDAISSSPGVTTKKNGSFGGVGSVRIRAVSYTHLTLPTKA